MKYALIAAIAFASLTPVSALAQSVPVQAAAKYNLDTPVETLAADEKAKAVLMANLPDLLPHPSYEMFKGLSLRQLQPYSDGKLTDELLAKVAADLAAIK